MNSMQTNNNVKSKHLKSNKVVNLLLNKPKDPKRYIKLEVPTANKAINKHNQSADKKIRGNIKIKRTSYFKSMQLKSTDLRETSDRKIASNDSKILEDLERKETYDSSKDQNYTLSKPKIVDSDIKVYSSLSSKDFHQDNQPLPSSNHDVERIQKAQNILEETKLKINEIERELKMNIEKK